MQYIIEKNNEGIVIPQDIFNQYSFGAKPFLKWAGGKTQLLGQLIKYFPFELKNGIIKNYCEPFLGSGAVFFLIAQHFQINNALLSDINEDLVLTYLVVQNNVYELIDELTILQELYCNKNDEMRRQFFYKIREQFNAEKDKINFKNYKKDYIPHAAKMIFLNKTCFNGLFRLNKKGEFNVPFGGYKSPKILDKNNLINSSQVLKIADISITDFEDIINKINGQTFIYFDPPYRPISPTSSFTSYSKFDFSDKDQIRLAKIFEELSNTSNKLMLSNSDPKNEDPKDEFFEKLYSNFNIVRVKANRMINSNGNNRGKINELLIMNY